MQAISKKFVHYTVPSVIILNAISADNERCHGQFLIECIIYISVSDKDRTGRSTGLRVTGLA